MWLCFLLQTWFVIDCLLARKFVRQQKLVSLCSFFSSSHPQQPFNPHAREAGVSSEQMKAFQTIEFSFYNGLYIIESVRFQRGGPACLSWIGPLLWKCRWWVLPVKTAGRRSGRSLILTGSFSSRNMTLVKQWFIQTMCREQATGLHVP